MPNSSQWAAAKARQRMYAALRGFFATAGYLEVETPVLVPGAGMEPHINPFELAFIPETDVGQRRPLFLHSSPEYAMKRLLADVPCPLFQICKVFRNGEVSRTHNPEFTLLEFYRPQVDYHAIMADLEQALAAAEQAVVGGPALFSRLPFERVTVREALLRETGIDLKRCSDAGSLREAVTRLDVRTSPEDSFEDIFFHLFLQKVEPRLGLDRPVFLTEYPAAMAALARLKQSDPSVAERFELYARGLELGNGFSELTDPVEQRRRFEEEQGQRERAGKKVHPQDERFLEALGRMPPSGGVAVGLDRILMLLTGTSQIEDVLLFPAREFL